MEKKSLVIMCLFTFFTATYCNAEVEIKKQYYPNGQLKSETPYKDGQMEGIARFYYPDGTLKQEIPYKDGQRNGIVKVYFKDGKLYLEGSLKDGERDGITREYDKNGNIVEEEIYKKGVLQIDASEVPKVGKVEFEAYKYLMKSFWDLPYSPSKFEPETWNNLVGNTAKKFSITEEEVNKVCDKIATFSKLMPDKIDISVDKMSWEEFLKIMP